MFGKERNHMKTNITRVIVRAKDHEFCVFGFVSIRVVRVAQSFSRVPTPWVSI